MQYYRNDSNYIVQAEQFKLGNLDSFVNFIQGECTSLVIYPSKCAVIGLMGFVNNTTTLVVPEGYYLVMGSEIRDTFPHPAHEFSIVPRGEFEMRFSKQPFKKTEITFSDTESTENEMPL